MGTAGVGFPTYIQKIDDDDTLTYIYYIYIYNDDQRVD